MPDIAGAFPYNLFYVCYGSVQILQFEAVLDQKEAITMPAAVYVNYADGKAYVISYPQINNELYRLFTNFEDAMQKALKYIDSEKERLCKKQELLKKKE